jgi:GT2 family glycosyltransferase
MGVSQTTNKALFHAKGRYIVLLDHDDLIDKDALLENLKVISAWPEVDMIYSDEDKIDETGNFVDPYFKPDWSEINLFTTMYTAHLSVYKKDLVKSIGGFRSDFDGTQDYDLALRVTEKSNCIAHIPKILYHWRIGSNSTAGNPSQKEYVFSRQKAAIEESLVKRGVEGGVEPTRYLGNWHPIFMLPKPNPLISIVIPTASRFGVIRGKKLNILENCLQSIMNSTYSNVEIIISTNNNDAPMLPLKLDKFCVLKKISYKKSKFNLAEKINEAVKHASGEFLILLNDDVEVISPSWIESMVSLFALDKVGCVGAKLLFENETIQHAGVVFQETGPTHIMVGESDKNPGPSLVSYLTREVIAVTGACLMVRKKVFEEIGGFDENFPLNYNDIDFCLRVRELGYSIIYEPSAKLYHFESLSKEGTYSIELDNFIKKWGEIDDPFYNLNFDRSNPFFRIASENIYNYRDSFYEDWLDKETIERAVKYISIKDELFKNGPSFSIVTSAFNTERIFLLELAASIKNQKYPNFEWVIVDNGSTNQSTVETLEEIARDFKKVNLVKIEKNKGIIGGMRAGLENAISDYILPMDSDDLITCDALILLCAFIKDKNSPLLIYSDEDKCDAKSNRFAPFFKVDWDPVLFYGCCYVAHLCAINRKKALELGVYLDQLANGCHDWDTFLRFIRSRIVPVHMNEIIYSWRAHSTSTASADPSVKTFTVNSQKYVLSQHIKLQGLSKDFKIEQNALFEHNGMWRLRRKEHKLPNIVFVITDQAGLNIQPHSSLMKLFKNYDYIEIDLFSDFQNFVNDNQFNDKSNVVVIDKSISIKDVDWLNEAVGLLEFFNDASVISATINSNNNKVVWAGGYLNYEFGRVSPYIDKSGFDSGYFGELFLQRSVDTFSPLFWISDFKRLRNANLTIKKSNSFATFSGEFARDISMEKNRIIISPFIVGYLINDDLKSYVAPSIKNSIVMEKRGYPRNRILVS